MELDNSRQVDSGNHLSSGTVAGSAPNSTIMRGTGVKKKRKLGRKSSSHRIIELEGSYKAADSNPLLNAGIQVKADLTDGCPIFF